MDESTGEEEAAERPVTRSLLRKAMDKQTEVLATVFEEELEGVKQATSEARDLAAEARATAQSNSVLISALQTRLIAQERKTLALEEQIQKQPAAAPTPAVSQAPRPWAGHAGHAAAAAPGDAAQSAEELDIQARTARFGRVGWDTPADTLVERAKSVIEEIGMSAHTSKWKAATRRGGTGSGVECRFDTVQHLLDARDAIDELDKKFPGQSAPVWMAKKKTRQELAPNRMLGLLEQALKEAEEKKEQQAQIVIERSKMGRCLLFAGERWIGISNSGELFMSPKAIARYGEDELDDMVSYARVAAN